SSPVHFSILQSRSPVAEVLRTKSDARSKQASPGDCGSAETSVSPFSGPRLSKELRKELDVLFFSRGRGKGHAVPDLSIVEQLRKICPDVRLAFASYATGAEVFEAAGESLFRMPLPERNPFADTVLCAAQVLSQVRALLVVSHEEMAVLPAAKIYDSRTVFLSHWFSAPPDPFLHALRFADEVLFMEKPGLFPEPEVVAGRVRYLGPVLRRFYHLPAD